MRLIKFTLSLLLAATVWPQLAHAADGVSVHAILIMASNAKSSADPKLAPYEATLQRNVPESSFRQVADGSASVAANGRAMISLGAGHRIEVENEKGGGLRLKLQWLNGSKPVVGGTFNFQPGVPVMLGNRPSGDGEVPIVLIIVK